MAEFQKAHDTKTDSDGHLLAEHEGKYLTFALADEVYGLNILKVVEIIGVMNITKVPCTPDYLKGVINLRGNILPVVDLRLKLDMPELSYDEKTCIIVVNISSGDKTIPVGMVVDTVVEVRDFSRDSLAAAPEFGLNVESNFIVAMGRTSEKEVVILIDVDKALGEEGLEAVNLARAGEEK